MRRLPEAVRFCLITAAFFFVIVRTAWSEGETFTNGIGMEFVLIPAGSFMMGSDRNSEHITDDETPRHRVAITKAFYMGKYEVTQAQWTALMDKNPSKFAGSDNPVDMVSWEEAREFIARLNRKENTDTYRLPTEAEWEYAARAGSEKLFCFGDDFTQLGQYGWFDGKGDTTHPVGQLKPNAWGLYDMHGNVWEWCQDWFEKGYYSSSPEVDPHGPEKGVVKVRRGGSWYGSGNFCRSAFRFDDAPDARRDCLGFRLVKEK